MEYLRWIILGSGIALVLFIYLHGRNKARPTDFDHKLTADDLPSIKSQEQDIVEADDVEISSEDIDIAIDTTASISSEPDNQTPDEDTPAIGGPDEQDDATEHMEDEDNADLVMIHVIARDAYFTGDDLSRLVNHQQLKFGDMEIYHAYDDDGKIIFSMSNMLKPGHFNPDNMSDMQTPGVILFMQAKLVEDPEAGFKRMLNCAETLSRELNGEMCDAKRNKLDQTGLDELQGRAASFRKPM